MYMGALTRTEEVTGLPRCLSGKESGRSPGGRHGNLIPVLLPGESPETKEPDRLQSMGSQRVRHDLTTKQQGH